MPRQFFEPLDKVATFYPNPCDPNGTPFNVVAKHDGTFEATSNHHRISLRPEDVQLHRWNVHLFRNHLAQALGLEPSGNRLNPNDRLILLGDYRLSRSEKYPVYWLRANDYTDFQDELQHLTQKRKSPFFLLTGTQCHWDLEIQDDLHEMNSPLLALSEALEFRDGQFTATDVWHGEVEAFRQALHPEKLTAMPDYLFFKSKGWHLRFAGESLFFSDTLIGLDSIQHLLKYPYSLQHGRELESLVATSDPALSRSIIQANQTDDDDFFAFDPSNSNYTGMIDQEARESYQKRLKYLAEQKRVEQATNDEKRVKEIDDEVKCIESQLNHTKNIHGRIVNLDNADKLLSNRVSKNIRTAIKHIFAVNPHFGEYLTNTIHCGLYSYYSPEERIEWEFFQ